MEPWTENGIAGSPSIRCGEASASHAGRFGAGAVLARLSCLPVSNCCGPTIGRSRNAASMGKTETLKSHGRIAQSYDHGAQIGTRAGPTPEGGYQQLCGVARPQKMVLIGSSTGGIDALIKVLSAYPANCPPTVIVQHTGQSFGASLTRLLGARCQAEVVRAQDGVELQAGRICLVAGIEGHAELAGSQFDRVKILNGPPVNGHMPSIDRLFHSAVPIAKRIEAAVLTGMGHDGAAGLLALRKAGAGTLVQDEETSVVYGMPRAAWEAGAADRQLPIEDIGQALLQSAKGKTQ